MAKTNLKEKEETTGNVTGLFIKKIKMADNRALIESRVYYDKFNPRIEITITKLENYEQWNPTNIEQKGLF